MSLEGKGRGGLKEIEGGDGGFVWGWLGKGVCWITWDSCRL